MGTESKHVPLRVRNSPTDRSKRAEDLSSARPSPGQTVWLVPTGQDIGH